VRGRTPNRSHSEGIRRSCSAPDCASRRVSWTICILPVSGGLPARQIIIDYPLGRPAPGTISVFILRRSPLFRILKAMEVNLTPDQKAFARRAIEAGRLRSEEDAVQEALALWEERERQRVEFLLTLDDARASLARGEGRVITQESMQQLASEVKERGRARLLAELTTSR
jgi:Arc/MetJ-type ribon-helix-helix transcriptional regulator